MNQSKLMKEINTRLDALNNWLNSEQDDVIREILEQSLQEPAEKKISKIEQLNNLNEYFKKVIKILEE